MGKRRSGYDVLADLPLSSVPVLSLIVFYSRGFVQCHLHCFGCLAFIVVSYNYIYCHHQDVPLYVASNKGQKPGCPWARSGLSSFQCVECASTLSYIIRS